MWIFSARTPPTIIPKVIAAITQDHSFGPPLCSLVAIGPRTPRVASYARFIKLKAITTTTTHFREINSCQPSRSSRHIAGGLSLPSPVIGFKLIVQTRIPAIKKEIPSIKIAQPAPKVATRIPATKEPATYPKFDKRPLTAFPFCNCSFGRISGSIPENAGHQNAFNTPKKNPVKHKSAIVVNPKIKEAALRKTNKQPMMSEPPTI